MRNLTSPRVIYFKAVLFLFTGLLACATILLDYPSMRLAALIALAIWSFARAYYFAFYVIEHYVDPSFHYAGLSSFLKYLLTRPRREPATATNRKLDP
jgi:hypothetical protein